jgi:hypothetical protein
MLKYYGASGIEDTSELILDSYLTSAAFDNEYVSDTQSRVLSFVHIYLDLVFEWLTCYCVLGV